jgi:hypothetical protein
MTRRLGALLLLASLVAGGCVTGGRVLTVQEECTRAGGVWMSSGCEHSAGGGGGAGGM